MVRFVSVFDISACELTATPRLAEKSEWPPMKSANFEQEDAPGAKYDITAKPHTYYLEAEGTGAIPVNDVVVHVSPHCETSRPSVAG